MKQKPPVETPPFSFRLDTHSGVPVYRQLIDQVQAAMATGALQVGDQLPTIRLVAVELSINPNTVTRAYREMEIRGLVDSQQGMGTFIANRQIDTSRKEQNRQLAQLVAEFVSRAGSIGCTVGDLMEALQQIGPDGQQKRGS
jgi:GntR family transcriptional regulator